MSYMINAGDTLYSIAKAYGTTVNALASANNIQNPRRINTGDMLQIPGVESAPAGSVTVDIKYETFADALDAATAARSTTTGTTYTTDTTYTTTAATTATQETTTQAVTTVSGYPLTDMTGHVSGYSGQGYYDEKGRAFTSYGAYLREDGFYYPEGAKVSKNGMYFDNGSGWQYAKHTTQYQEDGTVLRVPHELYGRAPGTPVYSFADGTLRPI